MDELYNELIKLKCVKDIKEHTKYKIMYVKEYIKLWLLVGLNTSKIEVKNFNFIDCMCNCGIYKDKTLGTPIEILKIYIFYAQKYDNINFNLFFNDNDLKKINVLKKIVSEYTKKYNLKNLNVFYRNMDVNEYLEILLKNEQYFNYDSKSFTLLFVDPYNFGTVKIIKIINFLNKYRSELIFNYFSSDFNRNRSNINYIKKQHDIKVCMQGINICNKNITDLTYKDLLSTLQENFRRTKNVKYSFIYPFHIKKTNSLIYYVIYCTPSAIGLEKLKEVL